MTLGLCCGFGLDPISVATAAPADQTVTPDTAEPTTAGEWYRRGIQLGSSEEFVEAAAAFLRSYELQPTSEALFNAGLAYQNAGDAIAAIQTYRRFLAEPKHSSELARAAERSIDALMREVGVLKVRYPPDRPPTQLYIAGELRELGELPLLLPPGPVTIEVVDERGKRARETYQIAGGEALVVDLRALLPPPPEPELDLDPKLDPGVEPGVDSGPTPEQLEAARVHARRSKRLRTATWAGIGLTGAAGIATATLGGLAARERQAYDRFTCFEYPNGDCPKGFVTGEPKTHLLAFKRYRIGAGIALGLTGGFAIGTLAVGLLSLRSKRKADRAQSKVRITPDLGGFTLRF